MAPVVVAQKDSEQNLNAFECFTQSIYEHGLLCSVALGLVNAPVKLYFIILVHENIPVGGWSKSRLNLRIAAAYECGKLVGPYLKSECIGQWFCVVVIADGNSSDTCIYFIRKFAHQVFFEHFDHHRIEHCDKAVDGFVWEQLIGEQVEKHFLYRAVHVKQLCESRASKQVINLIEWIQQLLLCDIVRNVSCHVSLHSLTDIVNACAAVKCLLCEVVEAAGCYEIIVLAKDGIEQSVVLVACILRHIGSWYKEVINGCLNSADSVLNKCEVLICNLVKCGVVAVCKVDLCGDPCLKLCKDFVLECGNIIIKCSEYFVGCFLTDCSDSVVVLNKESCLLTDYGRIHCFH